MHDRPPFGSFDEDEEWRHPQHSPYGDELPRIRPGSQDVVYPCPHCQSLRTEPRNLARRIGGAVGAAAGATCAAATALAGAEIGAAAGTLGGPFGVLCGSIAGAIIAGLAGAAAGCATGAALGESLDHKVLNNWRCSACGHAFCTRPD